MKRLSTVVGIAGLALCMSGCPLSDHFYMANESGLAAAGQGSKSVAGHGGDWGGLGGARTAEGGSQNKLGGDAQSATPPEAGGSDAIGGETGLGGEEAAGGATDSGFGGAEPSGGSDSLIGFGGAVGLLEAGASNVTAGSGRASVDPPIGAAGRANPGVAGKPAAGASATAGASGASSNLIDNPGFEIGIEGWSVFGVAATATIAASSDYAHGGTQSLLISDRSYDYEGPAYPLTALVTPGGRYRVQLWLRLVSTYAYASTFYATVRTRCKDGSETYRRLATSTTANATRWTELSGVGAIAACPPKSTVTDITLYVEGTTGLSFYIDDVVFAPG